MTVDHHPAPLPSRAPGKLPSVREPGSRDEILRELRVLHDQTGELWAAFPPAELFAPLGTAWSPADNLRHLLLSNRPVARALAVPRPLLVLRFGWALRSSRSYARLVEDYRARLAGGATAGRFAPPPEPPPADPETARRELLEARDRVERRLEAAVAGWSETALDRLRLPHPALGMLTVREMLFFTLYHNLHHALNVARYKGWAPNA
jgi:hypothetical protein